MFNPGPICLNGKVKSPKESSEIVSIFSPSFQYGLTVFEGIRAYKKSSDYYIFLLEEHVRRLLNSCKLIGFEDFSSYNEICSDIKKLLEYETIHFDIYIKYIVAYLGEGSWHSTHPPDRICFYYKADSCLRLKKPTFQKAKFTSIRRISHNNLSPKIKCGANYINSRFGYLELNNNKLNQEKFLPLFFDESGFVSESSGSTIFLIQGKNIITPSLDNSILPSITRNYLLDLFKNKLSDYEIFEKKVDRWDIYKSDVLFTVGTNIEIVFISKIDYIEFDQNLNIISEIFSLIKQEIIKK